MEAILPFKIKNEQKFYDSALNVGYNEMEIYKFIYVMQQSDLDIFPIMHDERINMLLYGWELCEDYKQKLNPNEWELPEEIETVLKVLVPWSMDIWFSKEWDKCKYFLRTALIHCLNRARDLLMRMPDMMQINWDFLLLYNLKPWNVLYLKNLTVTKDKTLENGAQSIETEELPATDEDIAYIKLEQLPIIVLRLVKFFDQSSIDMVKTLCMRVIAAWNKIHQTELETSGSRRPYIPPEDKRCLMLICHIYLMAVYESDDVKGYIIDNMINNIRFYYQGFQNSTSFHVMENFEYTPARYIALTNFHLRVQKRDFFDFFIWNKYDTSLANLFGVVSQAYKSYLLGNLLMELNNMNEDDFASNIPLYKRLMNSYVNEREKSEIFLLNELTKVEHQRYAHNIIQTVKNITDYESKICKGNRMSNIGNYENSDDIVAPLAGTKIEDNNNSETNREEINEEISDEDVEVEQKRVKESELRLDPVFQNLPNNESMLYYVYDVLAKKDYKGWHFAKVVLLVKIIGHEQNIIETWRYHPGLTTDFMLNLELKLSNHYVDLAKNFRAHPFLEQEFWLTAFYLNPTCDLYEVIKRLGMRNNRKRTDEHTKLVMSIDNIDAKYGLLSSTIDVKELATMANNDDPATDYDPLFAALHSLRVPDSLIKDMLTAIFLPRNRSFAWAVEWVILRNRCKMVMTSSKEKKRFVDLNMAEANERLKYLIIDYEKYKNRPQLDYGTIEQGYENLMTGGEFDKDSSEEEEDEEEEEEDFEDDEDVYESKKRGRGRTSAAARKKEEEEKVEDDNSQEDDPFLKGKRRTRARTAATLASFLFQTLPRSSRRKRNQKSEEENKAEDEKISIENDDRSSDSKSPITSTSLLRSVFTDNSDDNNIATKNLKECLKERPTFLNTTQGFQNLIDIWNVEKTDLETIDENCVSLMESSTALQIAVKLKLLNKEINPISCDEREYIDETEMLIHNSEYAIKKENEQERKGTLQIIEGLNTLTELALPAERWEEKVESGIRGISMESSFKLPDETTIEKETRHKPNDAYHSQDLNQIEENSSESLNSNESTAARKDSTEVSETNTVANSTRNSFNIDIEMVEKIIQNDELNDEMKTPIKLKQIIEKQLAESSEKLKEIIQTKDVQFEKCEQSEKFSYDKENKANEIEDEEPVDVDYKLQATINAGNKKEAEQGNDPGETKNQHKENNAEDKTDSANKITEENKVLPGTKTQPEQEMDTKNTAIEMVDMLENQSEGNENAIVKELKTKELGADSEINKKEKQKESEKFESEKDENKAENKSSLKTKTDKENKVDEIKTHNSLTKSEEIANTDASKNLEISIEIKEMAAGDHKIIEDLKSSNYADKIVQPVISLTEMANKSHIKKLFDNERKESKNSELENIEKNIEKDEPIIDATEIENKISDNNDEVVNEKDTKKFGETNSSNIKLAPENENVANIVDQGNKEHKTNIQSATCSKVSAKNRETIIETDKINLQETVNPFKDTVRQNERELEEGNLSGLSENLESNIILHYSSSEDLTDTNETIEKHKNNKSENVIFGKQKPLLFDSEKRAEIFCDGEQIRRKLTEIEQSIEAASDPIKIETTTKVEDGSSSLTNENPIKDNNLAETTDDDEQYIKCPIMLLDDTSIDFINSVESTDSETRELKDLCLRKSLKVLIPKLRPCDLTTLRQPIVKVQRTSYEKYLLDFRPKRRRFEEKLYLEFDDSSNSNISYGVNSSSSDAYRPPRTKRKIPVKRHTPRQTRTSDSDNDSINSEDIKLSAIISQCRKRRLSPASTSQSSSKAKRIAGPKSARKRGPKSVRKTTGPKSSKQNLVVTPRSASGLKLRISNAERKRPPPTSGPLSKRSQEIVQDEIIQLSSASSDEWVWNELAAIHEEENEIIEIEDNPLFEEEIII